MNRIIEREEQLCQLIFPIESRQINTKDQLDFVFLSSIIEPSNQEKKGNEMLKNLPIIRGIIAKREQARLEREAAGAFEAFMKEWEQKSLDECIQACGFSSEQEGRQAARFILSDI